MIAQCAVNEMAIRIVHASGKDVFAKRSFRERVVRAASGCAGMKQASGRVALCQPMQQRKSFHRGYARRWRE
ncbi:hypothetical protein [Bradyrhizobium sp. CB2312]|uniref:hypothetical protein n=1 Tax=Bradyrhizobium sp. CB2312 TaxID=3039155 RepID=UPI0024B08B4E|nr:hypothetical protein [Bradyrhizobium sp. CB2312]WFU74712.1 hypothetical protein QA642_11945 [Bradyrhizobium sp. CB2312]